MKKITSKSGGKRSGVGGKRPGSGRPPVATPAEKEAIADAREKGRSALPKLMDIWLQQAEATKPLVARDSSGVAVVVGEEPDWAARSRAIENIADRCGLPKLTQVESATASAALTALVSSLSGELPEDDPS